MTLFDSIVAGTDGSPSSRAAVAKAADLARLTSGHLHLVIAFKGAKPPPLNARAAARPMAPLDDEDQNKQNVLAVLARVADEIKDSGVAVTTHWRNDDPAKALIDVAEKQQADVIVVGNRGMRGTKRVLGSVPNDVSHRARCAVLIVDTT